MRSTTKLVLIIFTASLAASGQTTARDYYNELVKAEGLEGISNSYVCFQEKPSESFMTFSKSEDIKRTMAYEKFPAKIVKGFSGHFIVLMGYYKGVQWANPAFLDQESADIRSASYTAPMNIKGMPATLSFNINWKTLRYVYAVSDKDHVQLSASFGKCEDRTTLALSVDPGSAGSSCSRHP